MAWYSVRCIFRSLDAATYEERITLWRASNFDDAIAQAEHDAREYASVLRYDYVGFSQAYWLPDEKLESGSEVFSLLRDSDLEATAYLDRFFDTGSEYQRSLD
jgi:hypothetical protein